MPPSVENQPLMPPEKVERWVQVMWRQREELSDLDADALDLLCHVRLKQTTKPEDSAIGDVDEFLEMRGLQKKQGGTGRRGGYNPEQRTEILRALSHIQSIWLNLGQVEVYEEENRATEDDSTVKEDNPETSEKNKRRKGRRQAVKKAMQSRAFIVTDRLGQLQLDGYYGCGAFHLPARKTFCPFPFRPRPPDRHALRQSHPV